VHVHLVTMLVAGAMQSMRMCLQVIENGTINAVAFWFDLHLDAQESLTSGVLVG
jgi:hypothetical protein